MATLLVGVLLMTRWVEVVVEVVMEMVVKVVEVVMEELMPTLSRIDSDDWQEWFLVSTLSIVVLLNICTAIFQGGLIGADSFPLQGSCPNHPSPPVQGCVASSLPPTWAA